MAATATWFVASNANPRLYVPSTVSSMPAPPVGRAALVVPPCGRPSTPALTLDEAWALDGAVLAFFGGIPLLPASLPQRLDSYLAMRGHGATAAAWIDNPDDPPETWRAIDLYVWPRTAVGGQVPSLTRIPMRNFGLCIHAGAQLLLDPGGSALRLAPSGPTAGAISLTADYGASATPIPGPVFLSVAPGDSGTLRFALDMPAEQEQIWDAGIHFFGEDPALPGSGLLRSVRLPIVPCPAAGVSFAARIDPLRLTDADATRLAQSSPSGRLSSTLRDPLGAPLTLAPARDWGLAFTAAPGVMSPQAQEPLCLTPVGEAMLFPSASRLLLPGLAGSETIGLGPGTATLALEPGNAALVAATTAAASAAHPLDLRATTSWARLSSLSAEPLPYYAQPAGAELHSPVHEPDLADFMRFLPIVGGSAGRAFPLAPWAGAGKADVEFGLRLETTGVAPARRTLLGSSSTPTGRRVRAAPPSQALTARPAEALTARPAEALTASTPQGLLASVGADGSFQHIRLAICKGRELALDDVTGPLRSAMLTNRQFAVVTDPTVLLQPFATTNTIVIDGWQFQLDPRAWQAHGTVMIVKNHPRSVESLAGETSAWTEADALNVHPADASSQLAQIVRTTIENAATDTFYKPIEAALKDPAWNGILFFNCTVPLAGLPDSLIGLGPGIDPACFYAHHVRIDQTPVQRAVGANGAIALDSAGDSAIFALIDYRAPGSLYPGLAPYEFQVDYLRVLFAGSAVQGFSSQLTLLANQLFQAPVTSGQALTLAGHYQKQEDAYSFALQPQESPVLVVGDATVDRFAVSAATFATVHDASGGGDADQVHSRFSLDGALSFRATDPAFDLFGFDRLALTGVAIDLRFALSAPREATLTFDPSGALIDPSQSVAREGSLPYGFPARPKAFVAGAKGQGPSQSGLIPVALPEPSWTGPAQPWYALELDLDLGTVGALAGGAGITARLALTWSPSDAPGAWSVGLALPGATGGSDSITILGVLKISIYAIVLVRLKSGGYMLVLEGIALTVLGHSIPPGGSLTLAMLGDPAGAPSSLSWYGAYMQAGNAVPPPSGPDHHSFGRLAAKTGPGSPGRPHQQEEQT